jgi:hypothetical protein
VAASQDSKPALTFRHNCKDKRRDIKKQAESQLVTLLHHLSCLARLQVYPQNWMPSENSLYPGCYIESCNRMCRLRYNANDGQVSWCSLRCRSH